MLLRLSFDSDIPIYQQIRNQIVQGIASGQLRPGERLPTIRALAEESGINMMTVSKAYQLLRQEGYITADRRGGTTVRPRSPGEPGAETVEGLRLRLCELRLAGMGREDVLKLCARLYDEGGSEG